jgi:hypothetical protein
MEQDDVGLADFRVDRIDRRGPQDRGTLPAQLGRQGHVLARLQRDRGMADGRMAEPGQPYEHQQRPRRPTRAEGWHEMQELQHGTGQLAALMTGRKRTGVAGLIPTAIRCMG